MKPVIGLTGISIAALSFAMAAGGSVSADQSDMILVPGGPVIVGSNNGNDNEKPQHTVKISAFKIDKYEVTNEQFAAFVKATGYKPEGPWQRGLNGKSNMPVRYVTWNDAKAYAEYVGRRLPTEAEWEKAARGSQGKVYPWGNDWNADYVSTVIKEVGSTTKNVSEYGVHDMAGNAWEWTADWYDRYLYEARAKAESPPTDPTGPADGTLPEQRFIDTGTDPGNERSTVKVIKGGGAFGKQREYHARAARRIYGNPSYWFADTGFRTAISVEQD